MPLKNSTVTMPYPQPVNVLKALNYHSHINGISTCLNEDRDRVHVVVSAHNQRNDRQIQLLAQAYCAETLSTNKHSYKLTSVVVHLGGVFSGHFVTYRRAASLNGQRFPDRWLYTSDTLVKHAPLHEVMATNAYMLFYEKI